MTLNLEPLDADDQALIELAGEQVYGLDERILLASGRIVTGAELASLAADSVTVDGQP